MAEATTTLDKTDYLVGDIITATVTVTGVDPGSTKPVVVYSVVKIGDDVVIQSPPAQFSITDPPDSVEVTGTVSNDPAVVFTRDPVNQFVWTAVAA